MHVMFKFICYKILALILKIYGPQLARGAQ